MAAAAALRSVVPNAPACSTAPAHLLRRCFDAVLVGGARLLPGAAVHPAGAVTTRGGGERRRSGAEPSIALRAPQLSALAHLVRLGQRWAAVGVQVEWDGDQCWDALPLTQGIGAASSQQRRMNAGNE